MGTKRNTIWKQKNFDHMGGLHNEKSSGEILKEGDKSARLHDSFSEYIQKRNTVNENKKKTDKKDREMDRDI